MQTFFHLLHSSFYPLSCFLVLYFSQSYNSTADGQNFFFPVTFTFSTGHFLLQKFVFSCQHWEGIQRREQSTCLIITQNRMKQNSYQQEVTSPSLQYIEQPA